MPFPLPPDGLRALAWGAARLPGLNSLAMASYRAGLERFAGMAGAMDGVLGVAVHHGTAGDAWVPGLSDIDLALSVEDGGTAFLGRFWPRYRALQRRWPFLQEVVVATPGEWEGMAGDPIAGFEVSKCEPVRGVPLPRPPEPDPFWVLRPRLQRALSLYLERGSAIAWRPGRGAFRRAFERRLLGKLADLAKPGAGAALPPDPARAWTEAFSLLEEGCRGFLADPRVASQGAAGVEVPLPGRETALWSLRGGREAVQALAVAGGPPEGVRALLSVLEPLRNGFLRVVVLLDPGAPTDVLGPWLERLSGALAARTGAHPLAPDPLVLGPWSWRFLREVMDPLAWAAARDQEVLAGDPPEGLSLRAGLLADWARWECARLPYALRLVGSAPERLVPGHLEHQWRRALAVGLWMRRGILAPGREELLAGTGACDSESLAAYEGFAASVRPCRSPAGAWEAAAPHLARALALAGSLRARASAPRP